MDFLEEMAGLTTAVIQMIAVILITAVVMTAAHRDHIAIVIIIIAEADAAATISGMDIQDMALDVADLEMEEMDFSEAHGA